MKYTKTINLDVNKPFYEVLHAKQNDNARYLLFNLLNNGVPFVLTDKTVRAYAIKPDGTKIYNDLTIINAINGQAELQLTSQMLAVPGMISVELVIFEGTDILSTVKFVIEVTGNLRNDDAIESTNEFSALVNALANIDDLEVNYAPRLNTVESSLSDIAKDTTNFQYLVNSRKISMQKCRYRKIGDRHFEIIFPLENGNFASYQIKRNANDDYIRPTKVSIVGLTEIKNFETVSGTVNFDYPPNSYTTEVGTKIKYDFIGDKIEVRFFADYRGGVWNVKVDGVVVDTFSTHQLPASADYQSGRQKYYASLDGYPTFVRTIAENLPNTAHTVELEFIGDDPQHDPEGGVSRGWIKFHDSLNSQKTFKSYGGGSFIDVVEEIMPDYSNIDLAFSIMNPETGSDPEFIPEHSGKGTLWAVSQKVYADGVDITDYPTSSDFSETEFSKVEVIQKMVGRYPGNSIDLVEMTILFTFVDGAMSIDIKMKALQNFKINAGYFFMQPLLTGAFNRFKTGISNTYDIKPSATYTNVTIPEKTETGDFIAYHTDKDYMLTVHVENKDEWLRTDAVGNAQPARKAWIEYRDTLLNKVYFSTFYGVDIPAGFEYRTSATYGVAYAKGLGSIL